MNRSHFSLLKCCRGTIKPGIASFFANLSQIMQKNGMKSVLTLGSCILMWMQPRPTIINFVCGRSRITKGAKYAAQTMATT